MSIKELKKACKEDPNSPLCDVLEQRIREAEQEREGGWIRGKTRGINNWVIVLIVLIVLPLSVWGIISALALTSQEQNPNVTTLTVNVWDAKNGDRIPTAIVTFYGVDATNWTATEFQNEDFSNYTLLDSETVDSTVVWELPGRDDPNTLWKLIGKVNDSNGAYWEYQFPPYTGTLDVFLIHKADGLAMLLKDSLLDTDFTTTTERHWTLEVQTTKGGVANDSTGFGSYYDYEQNLAITIVFEFDFDSDCETSWADMGFGTKHTDGDKLYIAIDVQLSGSDEYSVTLGSGIGATYNLDGVNAYFGNVDGTLTPIGSA